jgi:acetylornithine deacetylase/succinyl-diaminopimelate desuccinylase family protein
MINKQRLIKLTQKVLQFDSVNPPGNEWAVAQFIAKEMKSIGLEVKQVSYKPKRPNILATLKGSWPREKAAKEAVLITPHIDTVPFGTGWKYNPTGGQIVGGKIYGRGASDDKGNAAVGMEVLRSLVEDGVKLKRDIIFAATVDEETGSHQGIRPLLDDGTLRPKVALITDSEDFDAIIAQKGLFHTRVQIFGKKAHGAYNWRGINAIEIGARVIERLKNIKWKYKKHPLLVPPTVNIGTIKGGDKVNMVADFCEFAVDIRYLPGMTADGVLSIMKKEIAKEAKEFKVIIDDSQKPYAIDPKHPFVKTYVDTAKKMGFKATLKGSQGATVITFFQDHDIPAFSTGWGAHGTLHANDEYAEIKTLYNGARVLEQYLKDYDAIA